MTQVLNQKASLKTVVDISSKVLVSRHLLEIRVGLMFRAGFRYSVAR